MGELVGFIIMNNCCYNRWQNYGIFDRKNNYFDLIKQFRTPVNRLIGWLYIRVQVQKACKMRIHLGLKKRETTNTRTRKLEMRPLNPKFVYDK